MTTTMSQTSAAVVATFLSSSMNLSTALSLTAAASIPSLSSNSTHNPNEQAPADGGQCHLLGPFAILVQAALGALALLSLVYKRWRERPQRPVKIWAFDVSKQVFGTVLLHVANLLMSMVSAGEIEAQLARAAAATVGASGTADGDGNWSPNPCSFYLLNLAIDTTLGIPILLIILKVLTIGASRTLLANPPESIKSGHYGEPPRVSWWLKQSILYFIGLLGMKFCVFIIFQLCPWIVVVGDWALRWTEGNQALQIAFVMLIFPLIMNAFQYYVVDSFIKKKPEADDTHTAQGDSEGERGGLLAGEDHDDLDDSEREHLHGDSIDEDLAYKARARVRSEESPKHGSEGRTVLDTQRQGPEHAESSSSGSSTMAADGEVDTSKTPLPKE